VQDFGPLNLGCLYAAPPRTSPNAPPALISAQVSLLPAAEGEARQRAAQRQENHTLLQQVPQVLVLSQRARFAQSIGDLFSLVFLFALISLWR
jgi:hypothetical protein